MKKICYIVPYFGKLPSNFQLWLTSCGTNNTVDWLLYLDDTREFDFPANVKTKYCSFDDIKKLFQKNFDFPIIIDRPWMLCQFRPSYGEIFAKDLKDYDFWGHCDIDLIWGDIRRFLSDEILISYDRIGFQGHSTLYKNQPDVNSRYKVEVPNQVSYKKVYSEGLACCFDENGMDAIYNYLNIPYYKEPIFAHLRKYAYGFSLGHQPKKYEYKNKYQIFEWDSGHLYRHYLYQKAVFTEEFMYLHFFCRPISYKEKIYSNDARYIIYPDVVKDYDKKISFSLVKHLGHKTAIAYFVKSIWFNRKKITLERIKFNISHFLSYRGKSK